VTEILKESEKRWEETTWDRIPLAALIQEVAEHMGTSPISLLSVHCDRKSFWNQPPLRSLALMNFYPVKS